MLYSSLSQFVIQIKVAIITVSFLKKFYIDKIKMNIFDRIDISGEIDVNKATKSKECGVFHYRFFR